ncbi:MAG TPA: transcriptional regulator [Actinomycetota bacterium]
MDAPSSSDLGALALLDEPSRRRLYAYVRGRGEAVGRDEAAKACGVSRSLAAFHLDRLAAGGLLEAGYRRLSGRTGRGAGRPAKVYRTSGARFHVSLPEDRSELAGHILARSLETSRPQETPKATVRRVAAREGEILGRTMRQAAPPQDEPLAAAGDALARMGFEPERRGDRVLLRNCPFHALATEHTELICAMNHALLAGVVRGLGAGPAVAAEMVDEPGECCVAIARRFPSG